MTDQVETLTRKQPQTSHPMICLLAHIFISHGSSLEQYDALHNDHRCHEDWEDKEDSPSGDQHKLA